VKHSGKITVHQNNLYRYNFPIMLKKLIPVFVLTLLVISDGFINRVYAQFEGEMSFLLQDLRGDREETTLELVFTKNRISIESASSMDIMPGLSTRSVLVRNDHNDFLFRTGQNEAYQIAKTDIDALVNLINRVQGKDTSLQKPGFNWDEQVRETGNIRTINGYETREFILIREDRTERVSVWLTDQIKVNWGLLSEAWQTTGSKQLDENIPIELIMNRNSFPLLIEVYKGDDIIFRADNVLINSSDFDRSKIQTAAGMQFLGLSDLMMNMIRQRR
jgi:hypothetical protein